MAEKFKANRGGEILLRGPEAGWERAWSGKSKGSTSGIPQRRQARRGLQSALRMMLVLAAAGSPIGGALGQTATSIPHLDMTRFVGVWYEVGRISKKKDKCATDALAIYTAGDKARRWALVNSCKTKDGSIETKNATVKPQDKSGDGKLKAAYTWPFYRKQWVLAVGPEYDWALVGSPDHKRLAVLSRTSSVGAEAMAEIKGKAAAQGFDLGKMVGVQVTQ